MRWLIVSISIVLALAGGQDAGAHGTAAAQDTRPATTASALPNTPVGEALSWVLATLNDGAASLTPGGLAARSAPAFREAAPPELMVGLMRQVAGNAPFTAQGFTRPPTATQINALLVGRSGTPLVVPVSVEAMAPHRIAGLTFAPVPSPSGERPRIFPTDEPTLAVGEVRETVGDRIDGLFDVGGRQVYLSCSGTGGPTVVLESGLGDPAAAWFGIEGDIASFTRVCSYDRSNTSAAASDPAPRPRTTQDAADDLHALLAAAEIPGPYVLVGHSFGGLVARLYASTYPNEVAGLVLVDATHEEQEARLKALVSPELWAAYRARLAQFPSIELDLDASFAEVRAARAAAPLRPMPLVVVTAGVEADPAQLAKNFPPGWPVEVMPRLHRELQAERAGLVPNGRQVIAERSGHYVHQTEPELVVAAIHDVVEAARVPGAWETSAPGTPTSASPPAASPTP